MDETVTAGIPCNLCGNAQVSIVSRRSRERLDALYAHALAGATTHAPQARRSRPPWRWVLGAWAAPLFALPAYC